MAAAGKGASAYARPRYGFQPTVMPKQVGCDGEVSGRGSGRP
ncbi:hypothetical protein I2456_09600 [Mycobacterium kubicae]|uniref:PPE family C-terminal domain-containing protein n=1 Tax=Mycobacterium kubicae TaxID=120959 RepID=A0AAX1JHB1_9MYCO|nr:hypothetical protein [Mycobacterium kubicae]QNI14716.1 hypothetical protein GAN18_09735 [Mycobacterium kubicae]QPI40636.1 hypothetical protein I2456_09600 [Mycobacterium kubicae]